MALGVRGNNMALLTRKQIAELITIVSNQSTSKDLHDELCKWNTNLPSPIEPKWERLPSKIKFCHLRHCYFDDIGNEIDWQFITSYERPVTPHPHAEMMAKYAEVAARRSDPWAEFERYNYLNNTWEDKLDDHPSWRPKARYRHIGDDK